MPSSRAHAGSLLTPMKKAMYAVKMTTPTTTFLILEGLFSSSLMGSVGPNVFWAARSRSTDEMDAIQSE